MTPSTANRERIRRLGTNTATTPAPPPPPYPGQTGRQFGGPPFLSYTRGAGS